MPAGRPPSQINQYKQEISTSFQNGQSISNITKMLSDEYQITIHPETIRRRLKQWGVSRTNPGPRELEDKIKELYFKQGLRDKEIIRALERDGIKISQSTLTTIWLRIGLQRRVVKPEDIQHTDDIVREAVREQLNTTALKSVYCNSFLKYFKKQIFSLAIYALIKGAKQF
ncbi:hypothetical protein TSTA_065760 [Talaromyces stipitatus ATCC 10500]|uniref:Clr5 domain-containing protein n=1 Tax=Talaromyces stipitatus (strain ATCC 10500 / CBS 375.48 / QM 6759 / NRRL 1006) TaxID=441959 RepID=B8LV73_TALSN|nr:uncharacterized protein TSTA_065760 [Talaromyces stipitatus ATCC 10500]EED23123.1 hypothetical protein TSTA_065760 [Talaromyces stipitatus ATCC 10500]